MCCPCVGLLSASLLVRDQSAASWLWVGHLNLSPLLLACSGGFYARNGGKTWIPTMLLTANLFPLMCFSIASVLNTVAISYHSLAAVPFGSIVVVLLIWILVSCPLCLFGTVRASAE